MVTFVINSISKPEILIVGASPDHINTNSAMRNHVYVGFVSLLGENKVRQLPMELGVFGIKQYKPKLVICFGSCMPDVSAYGPIRDACNLLGAKLVFWMHDDPYEFDFSYKIIDVADVIFSNDSWAALHYEHPNVHFLPMAASPEVHYQEWIAQKSWDLVFCGVGFPNRVRIIRDLEPFISKLKSNIIGAEWPPDLKIAKNQRTPNDSLSLIYAQSSIAISMGREFNLANNRFQLAPSTPGPRVFEAAMAGVVQICFADSLEVSDYFEVGKEILLFDGPKDFKRQVELILDSPGLAKSIAIAAQYRALNEHTYHHRAKKILDLCAYK